jgi:hypothetical protein
MPGMTTMAGKPVYHHCADGRCHDLIEVRTFGESGPTFIPGACKHAHAVPVKSVTGEVLGWLCLCCDRQLKHLPRP